MLQVYLMFSNYLHFIPKVIDFDTSDGEGDQINRDLPNVFSTVSECACIRVHRFIVYCLRSDRSLESTFILSAIVYTVRYRQFIAGAVENLFVLLPFHCGRQ